MSTETKRPSKCPNECGGRMWLMESTGYYWQWPECDGCGWKGEMESIPEADREQSDAEVDAAKAKARQFVRQS